MDDNDLLVHIVSVWPERFVAVRPHCQPASRHNASNHFLLERGSTEIPSVLAVGHFKEKVYVGHGKTINEIDSTTAIKMALCLVNEWAKNRASDLTGGASMGVWITDLHNPTPERIKATPEYRQMCIAQDKFCDLHIERARELHRVNKYELITDLHFICAEMRNVQGDPWQIRKPSYGGETAKCPWCFVVVRAEAPICHNCKAVVNVEAHRMLQQLRAQVDSIPDPTMARTFVPAAPPPPGASDAPSAFSSTLNEDLMDLAEPRPPQFAIPTKAEVESAAPLDLTIEERLERAQQENLALGGSVSRARK